jgi:O-antigen/teichoic acid export membrane protein
VITAATGSITVGNNIVAWMFTNILPLFLLVWPSRATRFSTDDVGSAVLQLLKFAVRANIATMSILAMWKIDQLIVGSRRGYAELGLYSVAVAVAEIVLVAAPAFRSALLPHHSMSEADLSDAVARVTRVVLAATVVASIGLAAVGYELLVLLYGPHYGQTYPAMLLLLPGVALFVLHFPLFDYIAARRGVRALTIMGIGGVAFNVSADYVLLGHYSYVAAAVISSITYAIVFATCLVLFVRQSGIGVREVVVVGRRDIAAIAKYVRDLVRRSGGTPVAEPS